MDTTPDCYDAFDESLSSNSCSLNDRYRFHCTSEKKCLLLTMVNNNVQQCIDGEDEPDMYERYTRSANISTEITRSQHCPHIQELVDQQILDYPILRRVKYYHLPCMKDSDLFCFHDNETFMCLCTEKRHANCFHFDFNMSYDCMGWNDCQNEGQCFQDHPTCPTKTICAIEQSYCSDNDIPVMLDSLDCISLISKQEKLILSLTD
ncbi:unnamed protein product [Rotaria sp. Silwood1]|nr:unnamed protein product [Rotaria sp. Silwood1]